MMIIRYVFILFLLTFLYVQNGHAAQLRDTFGEEETSIEEKNLKVLSWNIYMLPKMVVQKGKLDRAQAIVEQLKNSDFDVIVFQEAFLPAARNIIGNGLQCLYPYQYGPANDYPGIRTNSGIWIISKIALTHLASIEFRDSKGYDRWARKGAMLMQGEWHNRKFQILGTHLQADKQPAIRSKQMNQIYTELLSVYRADSVPQIICGDMNTENEMKERYNEMLVHFDAEDGDFSSIEKESYDGVNNTIAQSYGARKKFSLDYVLLRKNGVKIKSIKRFINIFKKDKQYLSDHYAIACEVKF